MRQMELNRIKVDERRNEQVIVLREKEGSRLLPVVIGIPEVNAIKLKLSGLAPPRPLTHDLLNDTITALGGRLKHVLIDKLDQNTFFAKLVIMQEQGGEVIVDSRPSDSIALALRAQVPIFVEDDVLNHAGINTE